MSGRDPFGMAPVAVMKRLSHAEFHVYSALRSFADRDGRNCHPGQIAIGERAGGMSRSAVAGHLRRLEELGLIIKNTRTNRAGGRLASEYCFVAAPASEEPTPPVGCSAPPIDDQPTPPVGCSAPPIDDQTNDQTNDQTSELRSQRARAAPAGFAEWWGEYPHKVGLAAAIEAYRNALARASPAELLAGVRRYVATKPPDRQWCNPANWLRQDRWLDEPAREPFNGSIGYRALASIGYANGRRQPASIIAAVNSFRLPGEDP
jgi:hypothetical protein